MKDIACLRAAVALVILGFSAVLLTPNQAQARADLADHVRVVLILDAYSQKKGADLSSACLEREGGFRFLLGEGLGADGYTLDVLTKSKADSKGIARHLQALTVNPNDTLVIYYCGHGGFDKKVGHFLNMGRDTLTRDELRFMALAKNPRALIMLTDACSTYADIESQPAAGLPDKTVIQDLFLRPRGVIDITAAKEGHPAWFIKNSGIFTTAVMSTIGYPREQIDLNRDGIVHWNEAMSVLEQETKQGLETYDLTMTAGGSTYAFEQQPAAFYLGEWPAFEKTLLVKNPRNSPLNLDIWVYTQHADGSWAWWPSDPGKNGAAATAVIPANSVEPLLIGQQPMKAHVVRWQVTVGESGQVLGPYQNEVSSKYGYRVQGGVLDSFVLDVN